MADLPLSSSPTPSTTSSSKRKTKKKKRKSPYSEPDSPVDSLNQETDNYPLVSYRERQRVRVIE